ncbi:hypothetical protein GCM10009682_07260 [Luedemannella flava]|uniref:Uncharacterized protein n=1 Tax=Luedemannella flava TaxID=349316 RepID=A0ABP4XPY0_9ACTN
MAAPPPGHPAKGDPSANSYPRRLIQGRTKRKPLPVRVRGFRQPGEELVPRGGVEPPTFRFQIRQGVEADPRAS